MQASPAAVTGYNDSYPDLLNLVNGVYQFLNTSSGQIMAFTYATATTATATTAGSVAGYLQSTAIKQGQSGTAIPQESFQYYAHGYGSGSG